MKKAQIKSMMVCDNLVKNTTFEGDMQLVCWCWLAGLLSVLMKDISQKYADQQADVELRLTQAEAVIWM